MNKIFSRFRKRPTEPTPAGSREAVHYEIEVDETGHKILIEAGKENIYDKIQAPLESTKIENILRRAAGGDPEALAQTHGQYLDCTNMPTSIAQMQNMIIRATNEFQRLPLEIRKQYNMSPEQYIADIGSDHWLNTLGIKKAETPAEAEKQKEVVTNGNESKH